MNLRRSRAARAAVSVTALALLIGPSAAGAWAQEESPAPAPTDTEAEETAHDDGKHKPKDPKTNTFHLGQSMQLRVNADGEQNAKAINFRWTVSQLTVQGPADGSQDGPVTVPVPEGGALPRYLENFGFIHVENGFGQWDLDVENGFDTQRSVSLFPQDAEPKIALTTEFTLDGEPVKAQDIVGKDGLVTATYTLHNQTTKPYDLVVKDLSGADVTVTAQGDSPMVAITKTLLPQRYHGLNTGSGLYGADGRGNNQVQWISLPFKPLSEDSTASFGWAAHVTDGVIPSLLVQVSPLYIPAHDPEAEEAEEEGESAPIPLDPAVATIQAGLEQVIAGLDAISASGGEPSTCTLPDGSTSQDVLVCLSQTLSQVIGGIFGIVTNDLQDLLDPANPESLTALLAGLSAQLKDPAQAEGLYTTLRSLTDTLLDPIPIPPVESVCVILGDDPEFDQATCEAQLAQLDTLVGNDPAAFVANAAAIAATLDGLVGQLTGIFNDLASFEAQVDLGTTEQAIAAIKSDLLARGGNDVVAGLDTVSAGVGQAKSIIAAYLSDVSAQLHAAGADANQVVINLRGEIGALKAAAAESPLIYGPLPEGTPDNTILFAAYEFRVDAADTNHPYTLPRILIGLLALIAAGLLGKFLGDRNATA